jgi:hypothetical protein
MVHRGLFLYEYEYVSNDNISEIFGKPRRVKIKLEGPVVLSITRKRGIMRMSRVFCIAAAVAVCAIVVTCNKDSGAISPTPSPRHVILSEGFEGDNLDSSGYTKLYNPRMYGPMSITTKAAHKSTYSLTSDSNNTGLRKWLDNPISDSIAGLEFYLMAANAGQTDFFAAIVTMGTSAGMLNNGFSTVLGMGIDKSDSLWYTFQKYDNPQADSDLVYNNFAALEFNKWYKCTMEYDFAAQKLTCSLDDRVVFTKGASGIAKLDMFITMRDSLGAQGPKGYFIDDITIYKR